MKPTDDTIALTAFLLRHDWLSADNLREGLAKLGFERPTAQWLTSHLVAMCKESCPRFERRKHSWADVAGYRVTSWAATGLGNRWKGFDGMAIGRDRPTPKPEHLRELVEEWRGG